MANLYAQQCMYNATMYNVMMQNMMPCIPMPCLPAYGYPMPYPSMTTNRPVNHAMAAGHYYEKGGRSRQSRKSRSKGDGNIYRTSHHRQHRVVSRHRYYEYEPSSESDNEDESIYTGEKGVQACRSVNRQMSTDKSDNTLRRLNPGQSSNGVKQQRLQNNMPSTDCKPSTPLQSNIVKPVLKLPVDIAADMPLNQIIVTKNSNHSQLTSRTKTESTSMADESQTISGIAVVRPNLPPNDPDKQNAVVVHSECQQEQHTAADQQDVNVAEDQSDGAISIQDPSLVSSLLNDKSILVASAPSSISRKVPDQLTEATGTNKIDQSESTVESRQSSHHIHSVDHMFWHGPDDRRQHGPARGYSLRTETPNVIKSPQSLHSLRKVWAEWETKYRPPPVSVHTDRGAGPQNVHTSIS